MILDAMAMTVGFGEKKYSDGAEDDAILNKGISALKEKVVDGTVTDALGECEDYGVHPQYYGAFPWALGPTMMLLSRVDSVSTSSCDV